MKKPEEPNLSELIADAARAQYIYDEESATVQIFPNLPTLSINGLARSINTIKDWKRGPIQSFINKPFLFNNRAAQAAQAPPVQLSFLADYKAELSDPQPLDYTISNAMSNPPEGYTPVIGPLPKVIIKNDTSSTTQEQVIEAATDIIAVYYVPINETNNLERNQ